jgi:Tfp pilus assembly protein PilF
VLYGDFGELLQEQNYFEEAAQYFSESFEVASGLMKSVNYGFGYIQNHNAKAAAEHLQVC